MAASDPSSDAEDTDHELVDAFVGGDLSAFSGIVERHRARLLFVARRYAGNEDDAEDILQEAFFKASRNLHSYRAESTLSTWLHRLVMNSGYDFSHHRMRREQATLDNGNVTHDFNIRLSHDPVPNVDRAMILRAALDKLRPEHRTALLAVDYAGQSVQYVAQQAGVAAGTIKSRRSRARTALLEALGDDIEEL